MYHRIFRTVIYLSIATVFFSCTKPGQDYAAKHYESAKPWTRWWWFASEIQKDDIINNLEWLKINGFGGVEIAWVYPLNRMKKDTVNITPRQAWLGQELADIVRFTRDYAKKIGLGCDFTFGTLWPFGDSQVSRDDAVMRYGDSLWRQQITASWEYPVKGLVVDHLNPQAFEKYAQRMFKFLPAPAIPFDNACFVDSWEVETRKLWTKNFGKLFYDYYGYDIQPFMDSLYSEKYSRYYYDYMKLINKLVLNFYTRFDKLLNQHQFLSRGQCSGAPCDILTAYSLLDIPETEALLFEPYFSRLVASSAALSGKKIISSETFTCIYGWPSDYIRNENPADLKLLADALFANGVNQIIWHGKPLSINDTDTIQFYASVHVGKTGKLSDQIQPFNEYMRKVSQVLRFGKTYSTLALYLPQEDAWMKAEMPLEKQFKWAWGEYEMRYVKIPEQTIGFNPIWINAHFLKNAIVRFGLLHSGDQTFSGLYVDVKYMEYESLKEILNLAKKGLPVFFRNIPSEPGNIRHKDYAEIYKQLSSLPNFYKNSTEFFKKIKPIISGESLPEFWSRSDGNWLYVFFAHPFTHSLTFPMSYGQSYSDKIIQKKITIFFAGKKTEYLLNFRPNQSILLKIDRNGKITPIDITYVPPVPDIIPVVRNKPAKWQVTY